MGAIIVSAAGLLGQAACAASSEEGGGQGGSGAQGGGGSSTSIGPGGAGGGGSDPGCGPSNPAACPCTPGEVDACYTGPDETRGVGVCKDGTHTCQSQGEFGVWGPCEDETLPGDEICRPAGLDENCNGEVDEGCACVPTEEVCDGLDNDCDGDVDEDIAPMACGPNTCDQQVCLNGQWTVCGAGTVVWQESFEGVVAPVEGIPAPSAIGSFTVTGGDVDALTDPSGMLGPSHDGVKAVDLNGWSPGTLEASIATTPGQSYVLTFAYTKNPSPAVNWPIGADVRIDGNPVLTLAPNPANTYSNLMWACASIPFTAIGSTTVLELESTNPNNGGVYLDTFVMKEP
jgi:uncharacterized protein DUF642/putative metal-binding protein